MWRLKPSLRLWSRIALYFSITIMLMAVLGVANYRHMRAAAIEDAHAQMANNLSFTIATLDDALWQVQSVCMSVFQDDRMRNALSVQKDGGALSTEAYSAIHNRLTIAQNLLSVKVSNLVYFYDAESVWTGAGTRTDRTWYFEKTHIYEAYDNAFLYGLLQGTSTITFLPPTRVSQGGGHLGEVIPAVLTDPSPSQDAVIIADMPLSIFYKALYDNAYVANSEFCIWNAQGAMIYESRPGLAERLTALEGDAFNLEGEPFIHIVNHESIYAWTYAQAAPLAAISEGAKNRLYEVLVLCIIALTAALLVMLYATNKLYSPMKLMLDIAQSVKSPQAGNALKALEKDLTQFVRERDMERHMADRFASAYVDYAFLSMLQGQPVRQEDLFFRQMSESVHLQMDDYRCCVIRCTLLKDYYRDAEWDLRLEAFSRISQILQNLYRAQPGAHIIEQRDGQYFLLWSMRGENAEAALEQSFNQLRDLFAKDARYVCIHIGMGRKKESLAALSESYTEALAALTQCDAESSFCACDASTIQGYGEAWGMEERRAFLDAVENLREEDALLLADQITSRLPSAAAQISRWIHEELSALLERQGVYAEVLTPPTHTQDALINRKELAGLIKQYITILKNAAQGNSGDNAVARAVEYIHSNFAQELSIERIASALDVSARSLSTLFREAMGMTIIEYLQQVRIDYIKGALVHTDRRISDIAAEAGLISRTTFARIFKRHMGMTPKEYRSLYQQHPAKKE